MLLQSLFPSKGFYWTTFQFNAFKRLSYFECCMSMALLLFLCIACTLLLYILYFSTEGHYGIMKGLLLRFSGVQQLCCHVSVTFQRHEYVQMFSKMFILKSWPGDLGNNLNVFIVFYWNKSFKQFVSTVWKVHSHFWHQALRFFRNQTISVQILSTYMTDLEITEQLQHRGYSNYLKSNQLHWLSGNWRTIEQYRSRKTSGHFSIIQTS